MSQDYPAKKTTKRDIQASERRQQILDVSKRLFAYNGYHATSMRNINKELGMAEALTYHYFPGGKLEILHTVLREEQQKRTKVIDEFIQSLQDDMSLREALLLYARRMFERITTDSEFLQIMFRERNLLDQDFLLSILRMAQQPMDSMVRILERRAAKGEIREMDFAMAFSQFSAQIGVFCAKLSLFDEETSREKCEQKIEKMVDFTLELWSAPSKGT